MAKKEVETEEAYRRRKAKERLMLKQAYQQLDINLRRAKLCTKCLKKHEGKGKWCSSCNGDWRVNRFNRAPGSYGSSAK
jgi:hypothetical protein